MQGTRRDAAVLRLLIDHSKNGAPVEREPFSYVVTGGEGRGENLPQLFDPFTQIEPGAAPVSAGSR